MKVLIFTSQIHLLGGAEKLAVELAEGLNKAPGVRADLLVSGLRNVAGNSQVIKRLSNAGVERVQFLGREPQSGSRAMLKYILKLRCILKNGRYEIIETQFLQQKN